MNVKTNEIINVGPRTVDNNKHHMLRYLCLLMPAKIARATQAAAVATKQVVAKKQTTSKEPKETKKRKVTGDAILASPQGPVSNEVIISFDVGCRNLAFCVIEVEDNVQVTKRVNKIKKVIKTKKTQTAVVAQSDEVFKVKVHVWEVVDIIAAAGCTAKKATAVPMENLIKYMCQTLYTYFGPQQMLEYTKQNTLKPHVMVEQQLKRGVRNVVLSSVIMTYFLSLYTPEFVVDPKNISFVHAKRKLEVVQQVVPIDFAADDDAGLRPDIKFEAPEKTAVGGKRKRLTNKESEKMQAKRYASNKRLAKYAIKYLIETPHIEAAVDTLDIKAKFKRGAGKCDDLAECMLQALTACSYSRFVPKSVSSVVVKKPKEPKKAKETKAVKETKEVKGPRKSKQELEADEGWEYAPTEIEYSGDEYLRTPTNSYMPSNFGINQLGSEFDDSVITLDSSDSEHDIDSIDD